MRTSIKLGLALGALLSCTSSDAPPENLTFPKGFLFGTAIAGFQVDMGCPSNLPNCTDPNSDWYVWVTNPTVVANPANHVSGEPVTDGPGFYELYAQDLDRAKNELGNNALRLSIEWSRLFPKSTVGVEDPAALAALASPDALAYYHAVFAAMKQRGLTPLVTLNHYALPTWIHDAAGCNQNLDTCSPRGWLDHDTIVHEISKYAGFVGKEFGGDVDYWATLNEPVTAVVFAGYVMPSESRSNPPGASLRFKEAKAAMVAMIDAHGKMYDAVKAADTVSADPSLPPATIGTVYNMESVKPYDPTDPADQTAAKNLSYLLNEVFLNATVNGDVDANLDGNVVHRADLAGRMDFIGINYYAALTAKSAPSAFPDLSPLLTITISSFTSYDYNYPKGIYDCITLANKNWNKPIIITETGFDDGQNQGLGAQWLTETLTWTKRAIAKGADVRGYFWWTLMDNYEWNHGMTFHLGMYGVDAKDPKKTRTARQSVGVYSRIATAGAIPADIAAKYPAPN